MDVSTATFATEVIEHSRTQPVLVDFWAPWCGPCRMLGPVLERLAAEPDAGFRLAKIYTDENQEIAAQYRLSGIPDVRLFIDGEIAASFVGAKPESEVRRFLRQYIPNEADRKVKAALEQARAALSNGDLDAAERHLAEVPARSDEADAAEQIGALISLGREAAAAGGEAALRDRLAASESDHEARYLLGAALAARGDFRAALDELLAVVAADRKGRADLARRAMLLVFAVVGIRSELADEYRRKLSIY